MKSLNLNKKSKYLLACSYGPDSMALFYLLKKQGYKFDCAIVNYHLREESNSEVDGLLKFAKENGVDVHVLDVNEKISKNIEAKCREIRYKFFKNLCDEFGYVAVLVAHHQDDHFETYIMQKQRQNYPIYYGINSFSEIFGVKVVRPLLDYSKQELLEICKKNNVPYSIDKTNFNTEIKRNKIRHEIVSKMSDQERRNLEIEILNKNYELQLMFNKLLKSYYNSVEYLKSLDNKSLCYCLNFLVDMVEPGLRLSKANVGEIIKILNSDKPNVFSKIKKDLFAIKEYEFFRLGKAQNIQEYSYQIKEPSVVDTPYFYADLNGDTSNRNIKLSDYPLTIRTAKKEDEYKIKDYYVSVRRLFIDWKMPISIRKIWPIITNKRGQVIYIPRYRQDYVVKENENFYVKF